MTQQFRRVQLVQVKLEFLGRVMSEGSGSSMTVQDVDDGSSWYLAQDDIDNGKYVLTPVTPTVAAGQVWNDGSDEYELWFVRSDYDGDPMFQNVGYSPSAGPTPITTDQFFKYYPEARLVFDPDTGATE